MSTPAAEGAVAEPAAVTASIGLHGAVSPFVATQEEWSEYAERLEHYFTANDIVSASKRRAILLNAVGPTTYRLLKTLASPTRVTDLTFEQLVELAKSHFNPKPSPIVKRYEFNTRKQEEEKRYQFSSRSYVRLPSIVRTGRSLVTCYVTVSCVASEIRVCSAAYSENLTSPLIKPWR